MTFAALEFLIFLAAVLLALCLVRHNTWRKAILLTASYYFYAYWDWRFLGLISLSILTDYWVGMRMAVAATPRSRKVLLAVSLGINLGLLGFFKYFGFFLDTMRPLLAALGLHPGSLDIILPVGISFYTFQTLSYTLDVYRGSLSPTRSLLDFALYVSFFPQLVAGPIVRAAHFLPQLTRYRPLTRANLYIGAQRFAHGLFKKVVIADRLAYFADDIFANAGAYDCASTWYAAVAYSLQIYFDFAGYSDMAIGVARIMGYDLGENFNYPYLSTSVREFWQRWHISLSTWVRDYVYIPMGGSHGGPVRTYVNLLGSMLLCGLWHGAAWTFVFWGGMHGALLAVNRIWMRAGCAMPSGRVWTLVRWTATTLCVVIGWVFFRAATFGQAGLMLRQMFAPEPGVTWLYPFVPAVVAATACVHWLERRGAAHARLYAETVRWYGPAILFTLLACAAVFHTEGYNPFIYFQF